MLSSSSLRLKARAGFSLAEVLIAIVIITILTIGSIAVYSSQLGKARDTERSNDISRIKLYLDQLVAQYGAPPNPNFNPRRFPAGSTKTDCQDNKKLYDCFKTLQLSSKEDLYEMFLDPSQDVVNSRSASSAPYGYKYGATDNSYKLCSMLEDQQSPILNSDNAGASASGGAGDDLYCVTYTPPGDTDVNSVDLLTIPTTP